MTVENSVSNAGSVHRGTPLITVTDNRNQVVRRIEFLRDNVNAECVPIIFSERHDAAGRTTELFNPRRQDDSEGVVALSLTYNLNGAVLVKDSVDAGLTLTLPRSSGAIAYFEDASGTTSEAEYDASERVIAEYTRCPGDTQARCLSRIQYGETLQDRAAAIRSNQLGRRVRVDDEAGTTTMDAGYDIFGNIKAIDFRFLAKMGEVDWPSDVAERDALLEQKRFTTQYRFDAQGKITQRTDAKNNRVAFDYDSQNQISTCTVETSDGKQWPVLTSVQYSARALPVKETWGSNVAVEYDYDPHTEYLELMRTTVDGELIRERRLERDPMGHLLGVLDRQMGEAEALPLAFEYDSWNRVVSATGWEARPPLPESPLGIAEANRLRPYEETYTYDLRGNMLRRRRLSGDEVVYEMDLVPEGESNRAVADGHAPAPGVDAAFDERGNYLFIADVPALKWNASNRLVEANFMHAMTKEQHTESYAYHSNGRRARKLIRQATGDKKVLLDVRYLSDLTVFSDGDGKELSAVATIELGRNKAQLISAQEGIHPEAKASVRFLLTGETGSITHELDYSGGVIGMSGYYPYGEIAYDTPRADGPITPHFKYSARELDASGLYWFGGRCYAPQLGRWLSPDPSGAVDGVNLYQMVGSNPLSYYDHSGFNQVEIDNLKNAYADMWLHDYHYERMATALGRRDRHQSARIMGAALVTNLASTAGFAVGIGAGAAALPLGPWAVAVGAAAGGVTTAVLSPLGTLITPVDLTTLRINLDARSEYAGTNRQAMGNTGATVATSATSALFNIAAEHVHIPNPVVIYDSLRTMSHNMPGETHLRGLITQFQNAHEEIDRHAERALEANTRVLFHSVTSHEVRAHLLGHKQLGFSAEKSKAKEFRIGPTAIREMQARTHERLNSVAHALAERYPHIGGGQAILHVPGQRELGRTAGVPGVTPGEGHVLADAFRNDPRRPRAVTHH